MKIYAPLFVLCLSLFFMACDNEVEINDDFKEVTLVYGLLDKNADTQFVKINRTFLDNNQSAIDLAKQIDRINYDTLDVSLINTRTNTSYKMQKIVKRKDAGSFSTDANVLYYTDQPLVANTEYLLKIVKPDGSETYGRTTVLDDIAVVSPKVQSPLPSLNNIQFVSQTGGFRIIDYEYKFRTSVNVSEFQVRMHLIYYDGGISGVNERRVSMDVGKVLNPSLDEEIREFKMQGELFFKAIEDQVPSAVDPTTKLINFNNHIEIEVFAADGDYGFYRDLNGPIDGLAQTRPEYTNIENGIGLFASRNSQKYYTHLQQKTRDYVASRYRTTRNFVYGN